MKRRSTGHSRRQVMLQLTSQCKSARTVLCGSIGQEKEKAMAKSNFKLKIGSLALNGVLVSLPHPFIHVKTYALARDILVNRGFEPTLR